MPLLNRRRSARKRSRDTGEHKRSEPSRVHPRPKSGQPPIIDVEDGTVVYPGGHLALDRLSLEIGRGEFAFVVGPTGCGKSTLIKMLIREIEPAAGKVRIAGRDINELDPDRTPYLRRSPPRSVCPFTVSADDLAWSVTPSAEDFACSFTS